ncbi:hypothetical protein GN074_08830, partial [Helicobacter pylori]|nr:hypothetical protein [Helicobacter pylori]
RVFYDAASPYDCRIGLLWQDAGGQWHYADVYSQGSLNGHSHFPLALRRFEAHSQVWLVVAGGFSGPSYGYTYVYNYRVDAAGASPTLTAFSGGGQPEINYEQVEILRAPEPDRFFVAYASTSTAVNVSLRGINSSGSVSSLALGSVTPYGYAGLGNGSHTINRWYITEWDTANSRYLLISRGTHPSSPTKNYLVAQVITVSGGGYTVTTGAGALLLPSGTLSTGPRDLNARALWVQKLAANLAAIGYYNAEAGHQVT